MSHIYQSMTSYINLFWYDLKLILEYIHYQDDGYSCPWLILPRLQSLKWLLSCINRNHGWRGLDMPHISMVFSLHIIRHVVCVYKLVYRWIINIQTIWSPFNTDDVIWKFIVPHYQLQYAHQNSYQCDIQASHSFNSLLLVCPLLNSVKGGYL